LAAKPDAALFSHLGLAAKHPSLDLHSAAHAVHNTGTFCQQAVAGILDDTAPMLPNLRIDQLAEVRLEAFVRPLLIRAHQARVPRHIGGEDRGEASDRGHGAPSIRCLNQVYLETRMNPSIEIAFPRLVLLTPRGAGLCARLAIRRSSQ